MRENAGGMIKMQKKWLLLLISIMVFVPVMSILMYIEGYFRFSGDAIVIEMTYRGLDEWTGPHSPHTYSTTYYNTSSSSSASYRGEPNSLFYQALKAQFEDLRPVQCSFLIDSEWAGVKMKAGKPSVFYMDLNSDGRLSENEAFHGVRFPDKFVPGSVMFHTPDFVLRTAGGHNVPYRLSMMVTVQPEGSLRCVWAPFYVLEGRATIAEQSVHLVLYTENVNDDITEYGKALYSLSPGEASSNKRINRYALSHLVQYDDAFYTLKLVGRHEQGRSVRVLLKKETRPTGRLKIRLDESQGIKSLNHALRVRHDIDTRVCFDAHLSASEIPHDMARYLFGMLCQAHQSSGEIVLPEGKYRIETGLFGYGQSEPNEWMVLIQDLPIQLIRGSTVAEVSLASPELSIEVLSGNRIITSDNGNYHISANDPINLTPQIKGSDGVHYARFSRRQSSEIRDVVATIQITNEQGNQIVAEDMGYT